MRRIIILICLIITFISSQNSSAQNCDALIKSAKEAFQQKEYSLAFNMCNTAKENCPSRRHEVDILTIKIFQAIENSKAAALKDLYDIVSRVHSFEKKLNEVDSLNKMFETSIQKLKKAQLEIELEKDRVKLEVLDVRNERDKVALNLDLYKNLLENAKKDLYKVESEKNKALDNLQITKMSRDEAIHYSKVATEGAIFQKKMADLATVEAELERKRQSALLSILISLLVMVIPVFLFYRSYQERLKAREVIGLK